MPSRLIRRLRQSYKDRSEFTRADAAGIIVTPAAKVLQLYGLDELPGPTRSVAQKAAAFSKRHPWVGWIPEVISWSVIGFDMAYLGTQLSRALAGIGPMLSDMVAYTAVMTHPSLVSAAVQKLRGTKGEPGISQYFQACSIVDIAATPVSLGVLSGVIHSGISSSLSVGRAVVAVLLSSVLDFTVWAVGFVSYWAKVIRRERDIGVLESIKAVGRGLLHPFGKDKPGNAWEEAGRMVGVGAVVWAVPVYAMRVAVGAFAAMAGVTSTAFNQVFFSTTNGVLGFVRYVANGIKNTLVERIIKKHGDAA